MKKSLCFILFSSLIITIFMTGCFSNNNENDNEEKKKELYVGLWNKSEKGENATIIIRNENNKELLNLTLAIEKDGYNSKSINCEKGEYNVYIYIDEKRQIDYTLTIDKYTGGVSFDIFKEKIDFSPTPKP